MFGFDLNVVEHTRGKHTLPYAICVSNNLPCYLFRVSWGKAIEDFSADLALQEVVVDIQKVDSVYLFPHRFHKLGNGHSLLFESLCFRNGSCHVLFKRFQEQNESFKMIRVRGLQSRSETPEVADELLIRLAYDSEGYID